MWHPFKARRNRHRSLASNENYLLVTYDSCRYDAYVEANTPVLDAYATPRQAYTQGTYTLAAHSSMFQGMLPHVFAEEAYYNRYVQQLWRIPHRRRSEARVVLPDGSRSIIEGFNKLGYFTCGTATMSWFRDPRIHLAQDWQAYKWFQQVGDNGKSAGRAQVAWLQAQLRKEKSRPFFAFVNFGETHHPYKYEGHLEQEDEAIGQQRTLYQKLYKDRSNTRCSEGAAFHEEIWRLQVRCVEFLDARMGELLGFFRESGRDVTVVVCGDHGDCFGEEGLFGHDFYHPKVMEVPMLIFDYKADVSTSTKT